MDNGNILQEIIGYTRRVVAEAKSLVPLAQLERQVQELPVQAQNFSRALRSDPPAIIAEVKKASPSRGVIVENFDPVGIATEYFSAGAAAISVLTEGKYFQGSLDNLKNIARNVNCPLLRKDFIIDSYQVYQAAVCGASAFLLIAAALSRQQLSDFLILGRKLGMEALVEVHNREELEMVRDTPATVIGVNNRDLKTFQTDLSTSIELAPFFPDSVIRVSESGIKTRQDIVRLGQAGYEAFLIGEFLMRGKNKAGKIAQLRGESCG
ncbi:indole-3-glycerol phosphate synthase TrpC [candidate division KSB1 bacterium]|nr:indole-3-glycerol phosphate synthase TrpC [candidate division KSB1 bacterium]